MRPIAIVSGVLGGGSALAFVAAAIIATVFPNGTPVAASPWGGAVRPMPALRGPAIVDDGTGGRWQPGSELIPLAPAEPPPMVLR